MTSDQKSELFKKVIPELEVTPEVRQKAFDNYETTDDHLMHIVGTATDQEKNHYYIVKNSWGTKRGQEGYYYISVPYMQMKTVGIMLHKDAVPSKVKEKIKL